MGNGLPTIFYLLLWVGGIPFFSYCQRVVEVMGLLLREELKKFSVNGINPDDITNFCVSVNHAKYFENSKIMF
jgi:hypothetical protein